MILTLLYFNILIILETWFEFFNPGFMEMHIVSWYRRAGAEEAVLLFTRESVDSPYETYFPIANYGTIFATNWSSNGRLAIDVHSSLFRNYAFYFPNAGRTWSSFYVDCLDSNSFSFFFNL